VAFLPSEVANLANSVCIVVDVLRASSTIVTLFERGCPRVLLAGSVSEGRRLAKEGGLLLAGERNGLPPVGFDLGNSPAELKGLDLATQVVVLTTSNGTAALRKVAGARAVLVGCFTNAEACCRAALELAHRTGADLIVVCAGRRGRFALDDASCAGFLAETIAGMEDGACVLTDAARGACRLWQGYGDAILAFQDSASGQRVLEIGYAEDLALCARTSVSAIVPTLAPGRPFRLVQWNGDQATGDHPGN